MLSMIPGTFKARDLLRDPRLTANAPITHPDDPNAEFKLRGRAVEVQDSRLRDATAAIEATSGWRPPLDWHFFSVEMVDAAFITWHNGVMNMLRWTHHGGLERVQRAVAVPDGRQRLG